MSRGGLHVVAVSVFILARDNVVAQRRLVPARTRRQGFEARLLNNDIRINTLGLDRSSRRGVVQRGGQPHGALAGQRDDRLDRALAK